MKYSKKPPPKGRQRLSALLRGSGPAISVSDAATIWNVRQTQASSRLSSYANRGLLTRISQGLYIPVPLTSESGKAVPEDPMLIAQKLYAPCYIGGWSAAEYWDLTEQIFRTIVVVTQKLQRNYSPIVAGTEYRIYIVKPERFFGLTTIWSNNERIQISDPTRTVVDMLQNLSMGAGLRFTVEILQNYMASKHKSIELLVEYLGLLDVGAVYKRMGFLLEKYYPDEKILIEICKKSLTTGYSKLDPNQECSNLVTKWRLWVPTGWK